MGKRWQEREFWLMILAVVVETTGLVDLPIEAIATLVAWIIFRLVHKSANAIANGKA